MDDLSLALGRSALSREHLKVPFRELCRHWQFTGKTGMGKTTAMDLFCRFILDSQHPLILLDGKGDLFERVLDYCVAAQYLDRVAAVIDPLRKDYAVGINYLELLGVTDPAALAEMVCEGLKKIFREEDQFKPLLEEWTPPAVSPLIRVGMTLAELEEFASMKSPQLRRAVFSELGPAGEREARKWDELPAYGTHEAALRTAVVRTRASLITQAPLAEATFGQTRTTIDWQEVLDSNGIVLIRCHRHPAVSDRFRQLLGVVALHQILQAGYARISRPEAERRDAFIVCDEFQEFACRDFLPALVQMRSFRLWFLLSHQQRKQLEIIDGLKEVVTDQCTGKLYFELGHQDAEETVHDLFQDSIHGEKVKAEIWQTKFRPKETTREVTGEVHTESESTSDSVVDSHATSASRGSHAATAHQFRPEPGTAELLGGLGDLGAGVLQGTLGFTVPASLMNYAGGVWTRGHTEGASDTTSSATGHTTGRSVGDATSRAVVPWYEYLEFLELSSRERYSVEEMAEECKRWLMLQDVGRAQVKIGSRKTLPLDVREVKPVWVSSEEREEFLAAVFKRSARPVEDVRAEIKARVKAFIARVAERQLAEAERAEVADALNVPEDRREDIVAPPPAAPAKRTARKARRLDPSD